MKRILIPSSSFIRSTRRIAKKNPQLARDIETTLILLAEDAFHPYLKTHKLKGNLQGLWACSVSYELRIVFELVHHEHAEAILLETIGTHDQVY